MARNRTLNTAKASLRLDLVVPVLATVAVLLALSACVGPSTSDSPTTIAQSPAASHSTSIVREGWTSIRVAEPIPYANIFGIADGKGFVLAFGRADRNLLGVWRSFDGQTWEAGSVPELPTEFGGSMVDIAATTEGFVGLAGLGFAEGSDQITSAIYTSPDGLSWKAASDPVDGNWLGSALVTFGSRVVVAGGSGVFASDDGGQSWQQTTDTEALGGRITDLVADGSRLVAVGYAGSLETAQPLLWASRDGGVTWDRASLGDAGRPSHVVIGPDGAIVVFGSLPLDAVIWLSDGDGWSSSRVAICCFDGATATPTGYVAVGHPYSGGPAYAASSTDARVWRLEEPNVGDLTGVGWTNKVGFLTTTRIDIVLGPTPYL